MHIETTGHVAEGRPVAVYVTDPTRNSERLMAFPLGRDVTIPMVGPAIFTLTTVDA